VPALLDRRLLFVTGKGGVGKTTVAAALGQLASGHGKRTLICEVDAKGNLTGALETGPTGFAPREISPGLWAMSMDTEASLKEYLSLQLKLPLLARLGPLARTFDFVANAAPGVKEILVVGKLCYEVLERHYDLVVVDAPASGHIVGQLAAPQAIGDLVQVGMVRDQTAWMHEILADPAQTGVVIVSTPEEMPVNETLDLERRLPEAVGTGLEAIVVNGMWPERFSAGDADVLRAALDGRPDGALRAALTSYERARSQRSHLRRLRRATSARVVTLPYLFGTDVGLPEFEQLAGNLARKL
jgi:anion-transporting  ArsA/GET3 family ATPase